MESFSMWTFSWLAFIQHNVFKVHVVVCISTSFYGWIIFHCMNNTTFCLSIGQLMDIWGVSTFWLLWILLQWTFVYRFWCEHVFTSLGCIHRSGIAMSYNNCVLVFEELPSCFPERLYHFTFPPAMYEGSSFCTSLPTRGYCPLFWL